ncbi:hypothetical protein PAHAL_5G038700 [Panicum hallii]|uniref:Exocyst subunit Exo70 family protein n=1 Tax=Panicum hallii TaxID=206008 RepID=A0A2T8IIT2_9POAL|nr:uncharacterized protein LOC112891749 [Panicum hallii]PVH37590.1 hypothetical protein PAHAL_5G038700 [Panicum hallii]
MHEATVSQPAMEKVYLAVGNDEKQCRFFLLWAKDFIPQQKPLVVLHIYRPATTIPHVGLGGPMVASMLREDLVHEYRKNERNKIKNSLKKCLQNCKVQAKMLIIDKHDVAPAILELINKLKITTLVLGAKNRHDWKSKTAITLEKQADPSCNILYLHEGSLISSRHQRVDVCTARKNEMSSLGGCHFSGSSNTTTSKSFSFFNSRSTANTFDAEQLDDPSLEINPTHIFSDNRFNAIIGLKSIGTFKELVSRRISAESSRDLYQEFHSKYCDILSRCDFVDGFDSVLGLDCQNLGKAHWKYMRSWPAVLEYIVSIINTFHVQLKQKHLSCDGFIHEDLLEAAREPLTRLFTVASAVCAHEIRKSPEKLFCILNMYTSLADATPTLRNVFHTESIGRDAEGLLSKLKDSAREIVKEAKILIQTYSSQIAVQDGGGITSLTGYLMRYLRLLVKHRSSLDTILGHGHSDDLLTVEGVNSTCCLVFGLIADLDTVLEKQSKLLSSKELQCLFLMNNTHFILQEIKQSDVRLIVGSRWIGKRRYCIKEYMKDYISAAWGPVTLNLLATKSISPSKRLRTNVLNFLSAGPTPLQNFTWSFNETCNTQMCWKVPCPVLRKELRLKIMEFVTPVYHAHLESLKQSGRGTAADFKLGLKSKINELFEG